MKRHRHDLAAKLYAKAPSRLEEILALHLRAAGLEPVREYRFAPPRRFRLDFAFVDEKIGIEVQGGGWVQGRHHRPQGYQSDCVKNNLGILSGWRILKFTGDQIKSGEAIAVIEQALKTKAPGTGEEPGTENNISTEAQLENANSL